MLIGLAAGIGAATLWGLSATLQARAFRQFPTSPWTAVVGAALRSPAVLTVALLDCGGMVLDYIAIQKLPLYLSQACIACSVIVTAVTASTLLHERPPRTQWYALGVLAFGLAILGLSAGKPGHASIDWSLVIGGYVGVAAIGLLGLAARRLSGVASAVTLGLLAGGAYGTVPVAARAIESPYLTWFNLAEAGTMGAAGLLAFAFQSTAMTRAQVNTSAAPLTVAETVVPAMVGVLLFDDGIRSGWTSAVVIGLILSIAGAAAVPLLADSDPAETVEA